MDDQPSRRERKKAQTRRALLDVGLSLIAERGIYGTRIEDITDQSDLGKGAFYNYFSSKSSMVAELVGEGVELLCEEYLPDGAALAPSEDRIAAVIRGHQEFFAKHPVFVVLFHQARGLVSASSADDDELQRVFVTYLERIGDMLVPPSERERASVEHRMDLAAVILGSIAGHRSFRIAAGLGVDASALTDVLSVGVPAALARRAR